MAKGYKVPGSGRKKGTPNKRTLELMKRIKSFVKDFDPIIELIKIYQDEKIPVTLRAEILKSIAPYMYPKRRSISGEETGTKMLLEINNVKYTRAQLMALLPPGFSEKWADSCTNEKLRQIITETIGEKISEQLQQEFEKE